MLIIQAVRTQINELFVNWTYSIDHRYNRSIRIHTTIKYY